jgi:hypothetical protein
MPRRRARRSIRSDPSPTCSRAIRTSVLILPVQVIRSRRWSPRAGAAQVRRRSRTPTFLTRQAPTHLPGSLTRRRRGNRVMLRRQQRRKTTCHRLRIPRVPDSKALPSRRRSRRLRRDPSSRKLLRKPPIARSHRLLLQHPRLPSRRPQRQPRAAITATPCLIPNNRLPMSSAVRPKAKLNRCRVRRALTPRKGRRPMGLRPLPRPRRRQIRQALDLIPSNRCLKFSRTTNRFATCRRRSSRPDNRRWPWRHSRRSAPRRP